MYFQAVPSESQDMDVVREGNPNYHNLIREISEDRGDRIVETPSQMKIFVQSLNSL